MQRSTDIRKYFAYELSPQPTSLFKDNYMRKTDKSQLAKEMRKDCTSAVVPRGSTVVVDGGYLLRVVRWTKGSTYSDVCQHSMWTMWDSIMVDLMFRIWRLFRPKFITCFHSYTVIWK